MLRMEWLIGSRSAAFRIVTIICFLFGCAIGGTPGRGTAVSAYLTAEAAWQYLGFVIVVWMSLVALRDNTMRTDKIVYSKPQPVDRLALLKFLGAILQMLAFLLAMFLGGMVSHLITGGNMLGGEVYVIQYLRAAGVLFFAASASYMLALLYDSAIIGSIVGLYWILTLAGKAFLAKFYFPAFTQNLGAYILLGLSLLCITLIFHRRAHRGSAKPVLWARIGAPLFLLFAIYTFYTIIRDGHDAHTGLNPAMERMAEQDTAVGLRAAGFLLPDQNGKVIGLSDFTGKILVVALWSPRDPDSVLMLDRLNDVQKQYGARGVQPVAVALSEDNGAAFTFARGENLQYPVVTDWGTVYAPNRADISPIASAYRVTSLPSLIITDRRRRVQSILYGNDCYENSTLDQRLEERLTREPQ